MVILVSANQYEYVHILLQESANVVPVDHSVDVSRIDVPQHEADLTTTICDEQAKADIYLPDEIDDASKKKIKCPACEQRCTKRSNLRRHIRRFHEGNGDLLKQVSADYCVACLLCEQKFSHIVYLKSHLTKTHAVEFDEQEYFFPSSNGKLYSLFQITLIYVELCN